MCHDKQHILSSFIKLKQAMLSIIEIMGKKRGRKKVMLQISAMVEPSLNLQIHLLNYHTTLASSSLDFQNLGPESYLCPWIIKQ